MRKEMVDQTDDLSVGRLLGLTVKVHLDDMKRVTIREQDYFHHNISFPHAIQEQNYGSRTSTFFSLGIAFPSKYGQFRVTGGTEVTRNKADGGLIETLNTFLTVFFLQPCSAPSGGSCIRTGCTASTTMLGPTTGRWTLQHQRTTCATSLTGSPMKGPSSTGAHPGPTSVSIQIFLFSLRQIFEVI